MRSALLVAATGGHLEQLVRIREALVGHVGKSTVVTFRAEQSESLLEGQDVNYVRRVPPRGLISALVVFPRAFGLIRRGGYTDLISTGSAVAVPFFLAGRLLGLRCHYIESAARTTGPSLTGRILSRIPGVRLSTQHAGWASKRWTYAGSIFEGYRHVPVESVSSTPQRVVVTLGTVKGVPFDRAVQAATQLVQQLGVPAEGITWQIGDADPGVHQAAHEWISAARLREAINEADLIITHAGVGSCLQILDAGKVPILLPRAAAYGEAVDDHQVLLARLLEDKGLAVVTDPEGLKVGHAIRAMSGRVLHDQSEFGRLLRGLELTQ